ncbi:MAG: FMN phosphatase YigB, HAD superfamily [Chloroflexi bacterium]|jgi:HAD superfamily hydrolase (TIGR01549 family)|nr:MAG: FMN phosphatase YigB, HAD superfamily [Chloroflexota bacterium]
MSMKNSPNYTHTVRRLHARMRSNSTVGARLIKAVFFDFYGTLAGFNPPKEKVQAQAMRNSGFTPNLEGIAKGYLDADELMSKVNSSPTPITRMPHKEKLEFFAKYEQLILRGAGIEANLETAQLVWSKVQEIPYGFAVFDDVLPTLDLLRSKGLTVGIISNIGGNAPNITEQLGLRDKVDFIVTSQDAGIGKPHLPIFRLSLARAGVKAEEAIHVGDSPISDIEGAINAGITPLLIDREGLLSEYRTCPRIVSIREVIGHL